MALNKFIVLLGSVVLSLTAAPLVTLAPANENLVLGQLLSVRLSVVNVSPNAMAVDDLTGAVRIFIRYEDGDYLEYVHRSATSARHVAHLAELSPGESVARDFDILYNRVPPTTHLRPMYAQQLTMGKLLRPFAFDRAGRYTLKAVLTFGLPTLTAESAEVSIRVGEPTGPDKVAWERLSSVPELALLLQEGPMAIAGPHRRAELIECLRDLVQNCDGGVIAGAVRQRITEVQQ